MPNPTSRTSLTLSEAAKNDVKEFQRREGVLKESEALRRLIHDALDRYFGRKSNGENGK